MGEGKLIDKIKILFEDENYVALDKPSGLQVHPDGRSEGPFLSDWLIARFPEVRGVGEPINLPAGGKIEKPGIVHRLDADTSGVIITARNQKAFLHLKKQFKDRKVEKEYAAFVYGKFSDKEGVIDRPIGRSAKDFRLKSAQRGAKGYLREAVTEYLAESGNDEMSFVRIFPKTGRTHQIRTHFKAINHSVVCDPLYAPNQDCLGFSRLALHATNITFEGLNGQKLSIQSPLPEEFEDQLSKIAIL